jgi:hypothetical protein
MPQNRLKQASPALMRIHELQNAGHAERHHAAITLPNATATLVDDSPLLRLQVQRRGPDGRREQSRATDGLPTISQAVLTSLLRRFLIVAGRGQSNQTLWRNRVTH